jgi:hypothetical protein
MRAQSQAIHPSPVEASLLRPLAPAAFSAAARRDAKGVWRVGHGDGAAPRFQRALGWLLDVGGMVALVYAVPLAIVVLPVVLLVRLVMGGLGLLARDPTSLHGEPVSPPGVPGHTGRGHP